VIGIFIRKAINQEPLLVYGDGKQVRAFSDIQYYMDPFYKLLDDTYNGEIFNIGADKYYTILEAANLVKKVAAKYYIEAEIKHVEPRHEVKQAFCDHSKAKFLLDFEDKTDLESLIDEMFCWAMSEKDRPVKKFTYEIQKGIYEYWKS
jgi:UDP-glucose 4-epimerase